MGPSPKTVRVVLVLEVPAQGAAPPQRAVDLADEFGTMMTRLLPGVRAHRAVLEPAESPSAPEIFDRHPGGLCIDAPHRRVTVDCQPIRLTYREFELLRHLSARSGHPVTRADLMQQVWGRDVDPRIVETTISERTVDTHIQRLRAKLGDHGRLLVTVRGRGYRFDVADDVRVVSAAG
jgi:two-component system alkaline phosphatase synthesis response regulator PhoP